MSDLHLPFLSSDLGLSSAPTSDFEGWRKNTVRSYILEEEIRSNVIREGSVRWNLGTICSNYDCACFACMQVGIFISIYYFNPPFRYFLLSFTIICPLLFSERHASGRPVILVSAKILGNNISCFRIGTLSTPSTLLALYWHVVGTPVPASSCPSTSN